MSNDRRAGPGGLCGVLAALLCIGAATSASAWDAPQWVRQLGTPKDDFSSGPATDGAGNVYISGGTYGSLGGARRGDRDAFLAKYSDAGALRWKRQLGTPDFDESLSTATDDDNNVYISGWTQGSLGGANQGGWGDAFVTKYSSDGVLLWTRQLGTSEGDSSSGVATDREGNVYISGGTAGSLGGNNQGDRDAFVAKYSSDGTLLWTRQLGTSVVDFSRSVATDGDGSVYICGDTYGSLGEANRGAYDAFVAKYSADGALLWVRQLGTSNFYFEHALGIASDGEGNVFVSGATEGSLGGANPSPGIYDAFVAKYSSDGALIWIRQLGTSGEDTSLGIATDGAGSLYISGLTDGSLGGENRGSQDAWLAKYSAAGELLWKRQLGTSEFDSSDGVATDRDGNVYIAGGTFGSLGGRHQGKDYTYDAWVAKYFTRR